MFPFSDPRSYVMAPSNAHESRWFLVPSRLQVRPARSLIIVINVLEFWRSELDFTKQKKLLPAITRSFCRMCGEWLRDNAPVDDANSPEYSPRRANTRQNAKSGVSSSFCAKSGVSSSFWCRNPVSVHHSCPKRRTDIAPRSSGKENRYNRETFRRNPAGNQSRPEEPGQQPEASLA